ncbi:MAG: efflux RND transporter periplasmic adaptor subunit, partial [Verrucomicrobiae bacterium]|nr:efflux RND transporter periplasmic adaptor subunit [Verrucomicrobiae bacterium]
ALKQLLVALLSLAVIAGVGWIVWRTQQARQAAAAMSGAGAAKPALVVIYRLDEREFSDRVEAIGTLHAMESADISANVTETVTELTFEDGQRIRAGEVLARLDSGEEEAMLEAAKAELAEQEREIKRLADLVKQGAAPAVRLEERETAAEVAKRRLEEIHAKLADRKITAPFDGIVGLRRISVGALVSPGTVIATLDQISTMKLDFAVPETFLPDLKPGLAIAAKSNAFPGRDFRGNVSQIDSRIDPVTRAITVRAEIPNEDGSLRPGMLMTTVLNRNPRKAPAVPERAIIPLGRESFVFVLRRSESGDPTAERVPIKVGSRLPGFVEAVEGLKAGDEVITDGYIGLVTGAPVTIGGNYEGAAPAYNPREG